METRGRGIGRGINSQFVKIALFAMVFISLILFVLLLWSLARTNVTETIVQESSETTLNALVDVENAQAVIRIIKPEEGDEPAKAVLYLVLPRADDLYDAFIMQSSDSDETDLQFDHAKAETHTGIRSRSSLIEVAPIPLDSNFKYSQSYAPMQQSLDYFLRLSKDKTINCAITGNYFVRTPGQPWSAAEQGSQEGFVRSVLGFKMIQTMRTGMAKPSIIHSSKSSVYSKDSAQICDNLNPEQFANWLAAYGDLQGIKKLSQDTATGTWEHYCNKFVQGEAFDSTCPTADASAQAPINMISDSEVGCPLVVYEIPIEFDIGAKAFIPGTTTRPDIGDLMIFDAYNLFIDGKHCKWYDAVCKMKKAATDTWDCVSNPERCASDVLNVVTQWGTLVVDGAMSDLNKAKLDAIDAKNEVYSQVVNGYNSADSTVREVKRFGTSEVVKFVFKAGDDIVEATVDGAQAVVDLSEMIVVNPQRGMCVAGELAVDAVFQESWSLALAQLPGGVGNYDDLNNLVASDLCTALTSEMGLSCYVTSAATLDPFEAALCAMSLYLFSQECVKLVEEAIKDAIIEGGGDPSVTASVSEALTGYSMSEFKDKVEEKLNKSYKNATGCKDEWL